MVERTADHKGLFMAEALSVDEVLGIGYDGAVADDGSLGTACGAGGIEYVG